jgi:hypothetical protein
MSNHLLRAPLATIGTFAVAAACLALGCTGGADRAAEPIPVPAGDGSGEYSLTADATGIPYLSWVDTIPRGHALRFSMLTSSGWSQPRTVASGDNWFVNWADKPSVVAMPDGTLAAHWLVNNGTREGAYGYGIRIALSKDRGATWQEAFAAGTDNVTEYSGFVSLFWESGRVSAVYLTPKLPLTLDGAEHVMTLSAVRFGADQTPQPVQIADADTCSCCTTAVAQTPRGTVVAYRDHEPGEIRDIAVVRFEQGRWSAPVPLHRDGWHINACPTNGPVLAAAGTRVAAAWFTGADEIPAVKVAFSDDAGVRFDGPARVDGGAPLGWPAVALLDDGAAAVTWLESLGGGAGAIRLRRVERDGRLGPPTTVARAPGGRSAGILQMVRSGASLVVAWRDGSVRSARVPLP